MPASVQVSPTELALSAFGDTASLAATVRDADGHAMADAEVSWASDQSAVATVDANGVVTAVGNGFATISAKAGAVSGAAQVTVVQIATWVYVSPAELVFWAIGDTATLAATVHDANGHPLADAEASWASADASVAIVDRIGLVTATGSGSTVVTATSGSVTAEAAVRVRVGSGSPAADRNALVALYEATGGDNWTNNTNWLGDKPLGEWHGVYVDHMGRVIALSLFDNGLSGPIPPEIGSLTELEHLQLGYNGLSGTLPAELGHLADLTDLSLFGNSLSGSIPPDLGSLVGLERLRLSQNQFSGPIPPELGNLANLTEVDLAYNPLSGAIPPAITGLHALRVLNLGGNGLSGAIPPELGNLAELTTLSLFLNSFSGTIPPELGNLGNLTHLDLIESGVSGLVPAELIELPLEWFGWGGNPHLCMPNTPAFAVWIGGIDVHSGGTYCNESDRAVLESLYRATGGPGWTNSSGWLEGSVGSWHGIRADSLGRVTAISLSGNGLVGELPSTLGNLPTLTELHIDGNPDLSGRLPHTLPRLSALEVIRYSGTGLCVPPEGILRDWLADLPLHEGTGVGCEPTADRDVLAQLYEVMGGSRWFSSDNWLTDAPLREWFGVDADVQGRVTGLDLSHNGLTGFLPPDIAGLEELTKLILIGNDLSRGPIPSALGGLTNLEVLDLSGIHVSGAIPPELGNLAQLRELYLSNNELAGSIPGELAALRALTLLDLSDNSLSGSIPDQLSELLRLAEVHLEGNDLSGPLPTGWADLAELVVLDLSGNALTGSIPAEFGSFAGLEYLNLSYNRLSGTVPPELAGMESLAELFLASNRLSGPIPPELAGLSRLRALVFSGNAEMSGRLPASLVALRELSHFHATGTQLCAPPDPALIAWLDALLTRRVARCGATRSEAYLTQAAQSIELPIALVAGEEALLRVFPTAARTNSERIPPVRASFFLAGSLAHTVDIPAKRGPIPTEVDESSLDRSANAVIPANIVQPGLEMVIEIDPDGTVDGGLHVGRRIPEAGRLAVEVRAMPVFEITFIPFLWETKPDSAVVGLTAGMEADPEGHRMLRYTRTLLPVKDLTVTAHAPVLSSSNEASNLIGQTQVIRVMEGGSGYYMGLLSGEFSGAAGIGNLGRRTAYSVTSPTVIAHEFGHNLSLAHSPCGNPLGVDPAYPHLNASPGVWGYDDSEGGQLVPPDGFYDLMSYCEPYWVSDYSFDKALRYRLHTEGLLGGAVVAAPPVTSLLVWGGVDSLSVPFLEPAFVVEAPPAMPDAAGPYRVTGRTADGTELFALRFAMPQALDGDGGSNFAFTVPAQPEWAGVLASITLSGPGGSATLDEDYDRPMAIMLNAVTGQVTGFVRDFEAARGDAAMAAAADRAAGPVGHVLFSRGIPDPGAWQR